MKFYLILGLICALEAHRSQHEFKNNNLEEETIKEELIDEIAKIAAESNPNGDTPSRSHVHPQGSNVDPDLNNEGESDLVDQSGYEEDDEESDVDDQSEQYDDEEKEFNSIQEGMIKASDDDVDPDEEITETIGYSNHADDNGQCDQERESILNNSELTQLLQNDMTMYELQRTLNDHGHDKLTTKEFECFKTFVDFYRKEYHNVTIPDRVKNFYAVIRGRKLDLNSKKTEELVQIEALMDEFNITSEDLKKYPPKPTFLGYLKTGAIGVKDFGKGVVDFAVDTVKNTVGLAYNLVVHPINTTKKIVKGIATAAEHPIDTFKSVERDVESSCAKNRAHCAGYGLASIASVAVPLAGTSMGLFSKAGTAAKAADSSIAVAGVAQKASVAQKVGVAGVAQKASVAEKATEVASKASTAAQVLPKAPVIPVADAASTSSTAANVGSKASIGSKSAAAADTAADVVGPKKSVIGKVKNGLATTAEAAGQAKVVTSNVEKMVGGFRKLFGYGSKSSHVPKVQMKPIPKAPIGVAAKETGALSNNYDNARKSGNTIKGAAAVSGVVAGGEVAQGISNTYNKKDQRQRPPYPQSQEYSSQNQFSQSSYPEHHAHHPQYSQYPN